MTKTLTDFLAAVGFGSVCLFTIVGFSYMVATIDVYLREKKFMKMEFVMKDFS